MVNQVASLAVDEFCIKLWLLQARMLVFINMIYCLNTKLNEEFYFRKISDDSNISPNDENFNIVWLLS